MKRRSMSSGFGSGMMGTYVSISDTYTGACSGTGSGYGVGDPSAAARAVTDVSGGAIFSVVAGTLRIFRVGSLPFVSLLKLCLLS